VEITYALRQRKVRISARSASMERGSRLVVAAGALERLFLEGIRLDRPGRIKHLWRLNTVAANAAMSALRRWKVGRRDGLKVPVAMVFSPTMRCNLTCSGCYASDYARDVELSREIIDRMLGSAERIGVFLFIITGGEPLMREGIVEIFGGHKRLLFLLVTNGTLLDRDAARSIARAGNIIPVVSVEGSREQTDRRRGQGTYAAVESAMAHLAGEGVVFGFSGMVTGENFVTLGSDAFLSEMVEHGCSFGFYTDYIPVGSGSGENRLLSRAQQTDFRGMIAGLRRSKRLVIVHLPDDEYAPNGRCLAVEGGCVHINAQGYAEPCVFAHFAKENIKDSGLEGIFRSPFLLELRSSEAAARSDGTGCALVGNREILERIAARHGAVRTDLSAQS
jgi:MoaA/NifB/PqqE/SkfB family radical SAM enzyme